MRFFDDFSQIFQFQNFSCSKSNMFAGDRLITGATGHKLDEN